MDRKTISQLVAFVAASYIATALIAWALITAITYVKEHQAMCICPTTEQPSKGYTESTLISNLRTKMDEAMSYLEMHLPHVSARIKDLGVDVPPFSIDAPVMDELQHAINALRFAAS